MLESFSSMTLPSHIAIIMDGNRRWARKHGKTIAEGHQAGAEATAKLVDYCEELGIKTLTLYTHKDKTFLLTKR